MAKPAKKIIHLQDPGAPGSTPKPVGQGSWLCDGSNASHENPSVRPDLAGLTYNVDLCNCNGCKGRVKKYPQLYNALASARQPEIPLKTGGSRRGS